ncbi:hypothetical protein [Paucisalibacillus globulus]|uniref:hypothetical protein n=1 Tax=Paucisalibacillus globulus TaxID=351095 RepID=UPI00047A1D91|nr:hypothetical protein [Paucisalibacillus globulus]
MSSVQKVAELVPGEQNPVIIMEDKKEVAEFIQKLQMEKWQMDEIPSSKKKMKEYILYQQETINFGESNKDKELKQVASLITYHDLPYIELKWSKFNLVFKAPEEVVEYLSNH